MWQKKKKVENKQTMFMAAWVAIFEQGEPTQGQQVTGRSPVPMHDSEGPHHPNSRWWQMRLRIA